MRSGGHLEHAQPHLLEFGTHKIREFLGFRHIDLVEHDDARTIGNRNRAHRQLQLVRVLGELMFERVVVGHRVAVGFEGRAVDHMHDDFGTLDMAQEFQAKPLAFGGARDQTRHIRDGVPVIAGHDHAEIRHQRGERVIGDFRLGGAHCCNQAGFARRGEANERDVRN